MEDILVEVHLQKWKQYPIFEIVKNALKCWKLFQTMYNISDRIFHLPHNILFPEEKIFQWHLLLLTLELVWQQFGTLSLGKCPIPLNWNSRRFDVIIWEFEWMLSSFFLHLDAHNWLIQVVVNRNLEAFPSFQVERVVECLGVLKRKLFFWPFIFTFFSVEETVMRKDNRKTFISSERFFCKTLFLSESKK